MEVPEGVEVVELVAPSVVEDGVEEPPQDATITQAIKAAMHMLIGEIRLMG